MPTNRQKRATRIGEILDSLIPDPAVPLRYTSPFTFLIAVLLSAQCTDERVNAITPQLFALAPTPAEMAKLSINQIHAIIRPCGLGLRKATAIHQLSKKISQEFDGIVPHTFYDLESLPGVGHKTASVILSHLFGLPAFPIDRHIFRSARRWHLSDGKTVEAVEADLKKLFPKSLWGKRHLQIILYARQYCPALRHNLATCPICTAVEGRSEASILRTSLLLNLKTP